MTRALDLTDVGHGLRTEKQLRIARMLREYNPRLSLRRIPESDPAFAAGMQFDPPRVFGVYEENVADHLPNWVFTVAEMSIDERLLARVAENDFARGGGATKMWNKFLALKTAQELEKRARQEEIMAAREEEMLGVAKLAEKRSTFRHRINGELMQIGDTIRPIKRNV